MNKAYKERYNMITRNILDDCVRDNGNVVLSPFSIIVLLCMAADSTDTDTKEEIIRAICKNEDYVGFKSFIMGVANDFSGCSDSPITANALCVNETISGSIKPGYREMLSSDYDAKLFISKDQVDEINSWVKEKTKEMIESIVNRNMNKDMLACLLNAVCFESEWHKPYESDNISEDEFHNADGTASEANMMFSVEKSYIDNDKFKGFVKPYKEERFSFMALLPKKENETIRGSLSDLDLSELYESKIDREVNVDLPEFKYDFSEDLTEILQKKGVLKLFSSDADFSPMTDQWIRADGIIHKAHIKVDRKGTKAAAVTAMPVCAGCGYVFETLYVCLNRPFIYAVMHNETGLPVFAGIVNRL